MHAPIPAPPQHGAVVDEAAGHRLGEDAPHGAAEIRATDTAPPVATRAAPTVQPTGENARAVAAQIAEVLKGNAAGEVEVTLSPEELGRVRLAMAGSDGAMTINVTAERGETLELLRRHIHILAQELRDLGFGSLSFTFGRDGGGGHGPATTTPEPEAAGHDSAVTGAEHAAPEGPIPGADTLDLRL